MHRKFVFVIGGVLSGLGKGVTTSSIALLLKSCGIKVTALKIDPYISVDAGTMRPAEHGEVFVTDDGGEIDQDLGNYERFLNQTLSKDHNLTTGKVFKNVIHNERHFGYHGRDAQMFPDVINEIKRLILKPLKDEEVILVEVGGTTGDLENQPFLHAARELGREYESVYILITYLPFLRNVGELKSKPTQHAVAHLRQTGIFPDFIITRSEVPIDNPRIETISSRCFIDKENIIDNPDTDNIYQIPLILKKANLAQKIIKKLSLKPQTDDFSQWLSFSRKTRIKKPEFKVGLVGKYVKHGSSDHKDVYLSVSEAINHASAKLQIRVNVEAIDSSQLEIHGIDTLDKLNLQGILIPQGWGTRGTKGKILAAGYARKKQIPFLGLCFGMQMAVIEYARSLLNLAAASSTEINPKTPHPVIHIMPEQKEYLKKHQFGGTIRLGSWPCKVDKQSLLHQLYLKWGSGVNQIKNSKINERHRHRYEVNNKYVTDLKKAGLLISGTSPDGKLVEAIELKNSVHPFYLATQFHPEYKSRPVCPHPVFLGFLEAVSRRK